MLRASCSPTPHEVSRRRRAQAAARPLAPLYATLGATLDWVCALLDHCGGRFCDDLCLLRDEPIR